MNINNTVTVSRVWNIFTLFLRRFNTLFLFCVLSHFIYFDLKYDYHQKKNLQTAKGLNRKVGVHVFI